MNDKVKQVILEVIDAALNKFSFVDKDQFYQILLKDYGLTPVEIAENYDSFHSLLADIYGIKHFEMEREIIRILHARSQNKEYDEIHEIPAFETMVESYFKEVHEGLAKSQEMLNKTGKLREPIK